MPYGRVVELRGTQAQVVSRLIAGLEEAGCEVQRLGPARLNVAIPGWDALLFPMETPVPFQQFFWDRLVVTVSEEGTAQYRMVYWTGTQILLHFLITAMFVLEFCLGASATQSPRQFMANFCFSHLLPALISLASFSSSRRTIFNQAFKAQTS